MSKEVRNNLTDGETQRVSSAADQLEVDLQRWEDEDEDRKFEEEEQPPWAAQSAAEARETDKLYKWQDTQIQKAGGKLSDWDRKRQQDPDNWPSFPEWYTGSLRDLV